LDDRDFSELSLAEVNNVNAVLDRRDRSIARKQGRIPGAFLGGIFLQILFFVLILYRWGWKYVSKNATPKTTSGRRWNEWHRWRRIWSNGLGTPYP
jgi:hypothetical protein